MARKDPMSHLSRHRNGVPSKLRSEILALGPAAVAHLTALVTASATVEPRSDRDLETANALQILAHTDEPAVLPLFVRVLGEAPTDSETFERVTIVLKAFARPELIADLLAIEGEERRNVATLLLCSCGFDDRIRARIEAQLRIEPARGAVAAGLNGDPALVPALQAAFDANLPGGVLEEEQVHLLTLLLDQLEFLGGPDPVRVQRLDETMERTIDQIARRIAVLEGKGVGEEVAGALPSAPGMLREPS